MPKEKNLQKKKKSANLFTLCFKFQSSSSELINDFLEKNVRPVYGAGIRTHDHSNMSRHPLPLDQGTIFCH